MPEPIRVNVKVDAAKATEEFKQARRDINSRLKAAMERAGKRVVLPEAKRRVGGLRVEGVSVASSLVIRARSTTAFLTTSLRGRKARAVGLMEYGGTVHSPVLPKKKKAVVVNGQPIAAMTTPRHYRPRLFLTTAVHSNLPKTERVILEEVMHAFDGLPHTP